MAKILNNEFSTAKIGGIGQFTEDQLASVDSTTPNLKMGATYLVLPQIAHTELRVVKDGDGTTREVNSNRFGAIEFINGEVTGIVSIGVSALRATYISDDATFKPNVRMEERTEGRSKGLFRPVVGQDIHIPTLNVPAPIETRVIGDVKTLVMAIPFAFKVLNRKNYWQFIFREEEDGRWNMAIDSDCYAKVQLRRDYVLEACEIPSGKYDLRAFIPQLEDYAL